MILRLTLQVISESVSHAQGYGFLSENATFVDICKDHGIEFIGPTSTHINIMGDKSTARDTMKVSPPDRPPGCVSFIQDFWVPLSRGCCLHLASSMVQEAGTG